MTPTGSITRWIESLKDGNGNAAQKLWEQYFQGMVDLARQRLRSVPRRAADEEDVALSAFNSFCLGARDGRFPRLTDRDSLWPLLVAITAHKAVDLIRRNNRQKRGGLGRAVPGQDQSPTGRRACTAEVDLNQLISRTPDPEFALQIAEELERLLDRLDRAGDADLRSIALGKMEGESTTEIAARLGCVRRTIERKLQVIASLWEREMQP